jgi:two-component system, OmpR family, sensor histidine kinase VicK
LAKKLQFFLLNVTVQNNLFNHHFSEEQLLDIFAKSKDATAIYTGEQFYIQFANEQFVNLFDKAPEIIGQPLLEAIPELKGHEYVKLLQSVWQSGEARTIESIYMQVDGMRSPELFDLVYFPVLDVDGKTYCILQTSIEVTEVVNRRRQALQREKEMLALNKQLLEKNDQLKQDHLQLERTVNAVEESRARVRQMIDSSPVAMLIFRGNDFVFEEVNARMLQVLGKEASIEGKPLMDVMPELKGQPILDVIDKAFYSGKEQRVKEERVWFIRDGKAFHGYYNVTYTPLWENGVVTGILQSAEDVTEAVTARKQIQQAEERLRLAVEAAQMGTFSVHTQTFAFQASDRFRELFGFSPGETLSYDLCMQQIRDDFRPDVVNKLNGVMKTGERVEIEFPVMNHVDGGTRWLRGGGTLQRDHQGSGGYFTGIVIEISS